MPYYLGLGASLVYMSQHWHFCIFSWHFLTFFMCNKRAYPCHGTCRGTLSNGPPPLPPPPPLRVMVAQPAQVTRVPITLTQHDIAAAPCDTTHPMWRHRGTARPEPPPSPPPWLGKLQRLKCKETFIKALNPNLRCYWNLGTWATSMQKVGVPLYKGSEIQILE